VTTAPSPSAPQALITAACDFGPNYIDFQNASGAYVSPPGYGTFTVGTNMSALSGLGITPGEIGEIQSINDPTGSVTLPGPFITFHGAGSQYQLVATEIPAGDIVGPITARDNTDGTSTDFWEVDGTVSGMSGSTFRLFFSANFPFSVAAQFTMLPYNTTCTATSAQLVASSSRTAH
jgi:hypothetical protein